MGALCCKEEDIDFDGEIELSHFHLLRSVGKGAFGKVRVVQHKKTKEIYALKYINKAKCIRMRAVENIIQERRLLEEVEFSLICNLRYAFQDDENLFMVLDLMLGGDLRFHLERAGPMREEVVRFYVAELALALNALHSRRIIHRQVQGRAGIRSQECLGVNKKESRMDLKPDNVLLDEHGHAHLTDFNIAVYFNPSKPLISIAGSMAYMAPEVLLRKGYFASVDWWSLGVIMFELLFGKRPFRGKTNDLLTNSILRDQLPFPENVHEIVSSQCLDVLSRLCERDISKRLGCTPEGLDAFKNHPWFHGMDWDKLISKEATPPFQPDSKRANFDATHELEELLMEDNPLKAKKRAQTSPETELPAEMQMMEDKFTIYDFTKVRRSHSINRSRILRPTTNSDPKMSSGTLDGVVRRTGSGRLDNLIPASTPTSPSQTHPPQPTITPVPKAHRADSPSDRVGQDRMDSERQAEYYELQKQTPQPPLTSLKLEDIMRSEAIVLPSTSLPRPLPSRDETSGYRGGQGRQYNPSTATTASSAMTSATIKTGSTILTSAPSSTLVTPTSVKSDLCLLPQPLQQGNQGNYYTTNHGSNNSSNLSSNLSSSGGSSNSTALAMAMAAPSSQEPIMVTVEKNPPPVAKRAVRGREALGQQGHVVNSMPAAVPTVSSPTSIGPSDRAPYVQRGNSNPRRPLEQAPPQQQHYRQGSFPQPHMHSQPVRTTSDYTFEEGSAGRDSHGNGHGHGNGFHRYPSEPTIRSDDRNLYRQPPPQQQQQYSASGY
ncbi:kinase-like domain-containing protein [Mortierella sp. GBAus27b]|nr:kinase-like domain-containing protein [Mortierella sp. GBAus27b]